MAGPATDIAGLTAQRIPAFRMDLGSASNTATIGSAGIARGLARLGKGIIFVYFATNALHQ